MVIVLVAVLRSRSFYDRLRLQVLFFTGSGSFSYKNRLKSSKNMFLPSRLYTGSGGRKSTFCSANVGLSTNSATFPCTNYRVRTSHIERTEQSVTFPCTTGSRGHSKDDRIERHIGLNAKRDQKNSLHSNYSKTPKSRQVG